MKKRKRLVQPEDDPLFDVRQAASMTECTGILPFQVETPEERQSVADLGAIHLPEND